MVFDTKNVVISAIENFLEAFEVGELAQNWTEGLLSQNILNPLELDFIKILAGEIFATSFFFLRVAWT